MNQFIVFQLAIIIPFIAGSLLSNPFPQLPKSADRIILLNLTVFEPIIVFWSIWGLSITGELIILPLAGLAMVLIGFFIGKLFERFLVTDKIHRRTFVISSSLANHGFTMGGVICFLFAGEKGLALSSLFIAYFIPFTFLFIFFYAGFDKGTHVLSLKNTALFFFNARNTPLLAVIVAILLNFLGLSRPVMAFPLIPLLLISIGLYYLALGINFKPTDLYLLKIEHAFLALSKFMIVPIITFGVTCQLPISPDIRMVIMLESFMPAAVYSVIVSILFKLDTRLASGLFIINSLLFIFFVLPAMFLVRQLM